MIQFENTYQRQDQVEAACTYYARLGFSVTVRGNTVHVTGDARPCALCGATGSTCYETGGGHNYWLCPTDHDIFAAVLDGVEQEPIFTPFPDIQHIEGVDGFARSELPGAGEALELREWRRAAAAWIREGCNDDAWRKHMISYHGWSVGRLTAAAAKALA